jgi:hypothetical protein
MQPHPRSESWEGPTGLIEQEVRKAMVHPAATASGPVDSVAAGSELLGRAPEPPFGAGLQR